MNRNYFSQFKTLSLALAFLVTLPINLASATELKCEDSAIGLGIHLAYPNSTLEIDGQSIVLSTYFRINDPIDEIVMRRLLRAGMMNYQLSLDGKNVHYEVSVPDLDVARAFGYSDKIMIYERKTVKNPGLLASNFKKVLVGTITCDYKFSDVVRIQAIDESGYEEFESRSISTEELHERARVSQSHIDEIRRISALKEEKNRQTRYDESQRSEQLVVVHRRDGYGSPYTEYVPASQAPYGSEPVVVVRGYDYQTGPSTSYVPASQAPYGSEPVFVVYGGEGYGESGTRFVPARPQGNNDFDRSCTDPNNCSR